MTVNSCNKEKPPYRVVSWCLLLPPFLSTVYEKIIQVLSWVNHNWVTVHVIMRLSLLLIYLLYDMKASPNRFYLLYMYVSDERNCLEPSTYRPSVGSAWSLFHRQRSPGGSCRPSFYRITRQGLDDFTVMWRRPLYTQSDGGFFFRETFTAWFVLLQMLKRWTNHVVNVKDKLWLSIRQKNAHFSKIIRFFKFQPMRVPAVFRLKLC